jgi:predicted lipoprotein with Yx(FWY)xxD motif
MSLARPLVLPLLIAVGLLALAAPAMAAPGAARPVAVVQTDQAIGRALFTVKHRALYYWQVEKKAGGQIRCTGSCAALWPPLIVGSASAVTKTIVGASGTFGVIRRPDGKLQATFRGLPLYTYVHEGPNEIRCDNVNGWFAVRAQPA